jgi:hypothetical protein
MLILFPDDRATLDARELILAPEPALQAGSPIIGRPRGYLDLIEPGYVVPLGPDFELAGRKRAKSNAVRIHRSMRPACLKTNSGDGAPISWCDRSSLRG